MRRPWQLCRPAAALAALAALVAPAAPAAAEDSPRSLAMSAEPADPERARFTVSGYVSPQFGVRYRPSGVPRDRMDYSAASTRTGLIVGGEPVEHWSYTFHIEVTGEILTAIVDPDAAKEDGGGDGNGFVPLAADLSRAASAVNLEEVSVSYDPLDQFGVKIGQMRIPFTVQQQSPSTALMFPNRSGPNEVFLRGSDLGAMSSVSYHDRAQLRAGLFNGSGVSQTQDNERGLLYAMRVDLSPLGQFPFTEGDHERGPLRLGVGAGLLYLPSTLFDGAGFETVRVRDLRASASVRMAVRGLYVQGELLRRQRTDSFSSRPLIATGAYGQASYFVPMEGRLALSPIARVGWTERDQGFDPRTTVWTEAGATLYIGRRAGDANDLRLTLQYLGERRVSEGENAHGAVAQVQLRW